MNDVVSTCETFYTADAILDAKKAFFDIVGEHDGIRFIDRRGKSGKNPEKMNLEDLVNAMTKCDNDGIEMPTFLSADFSNVPHGNDGNVSTSQLLSMIVGMKAQLSSLEKKCFVPATNVTTDVSAISLNNREPPSFASALSVASTASSSLAASSSSLAASSSSLAASSSSLAASSALAPAAHVFTPDSVSVALASAMPNNSAQISARQTGKSAKQTGKTAENRIKTSSDRKKGIVIGKMPSSGVISWRGAPLTVDCYIGRVDHDATADQVKAFVVSKGVDVVEIEENATRHQRFKSFKLVIKKVDYEKLDNRDEWPEGVVFRRFWRPRNAGADGVDAQNRT